MSNVALVIVYSHRYDKNIDLLEKIYGERFSNIYHIMPFYSGNKSNVIAVYEHSYRFQGYLTQAFDRYYNASYEHYFFVADDLLLNPAINEHNYKDHLKLDNETAFLPGFISLHTWSHEQWGKRIRQAYEYDTKLPGCEIVNELPSYEEAVARFAEAGLEVKPLTFDQIYGGANKGGPLLSMRGIKHRLRHMKHRATAFPLKYPLVGSYSDILVVPAPHIKQFVRTCGIFAASNLFVELAIPTALVLTTPRIRIEKKDLELQGKAMWVKEEFQMVEPYENNLTKLLSDFPKQHLYLHPIKLSKWHW